MSAASKGASEGASDGASGHDVLRLATRLPRASVSVKTTAILPDLRRHLAVYRVRRRQPNPTMASNYPPPLAAASVAESGSGNEGTPGQEQPIDRASQASPRIGQGPPSQSYGQSPQELSIPPQQPAPQGQHYHNNNGDNGHNSSAEQIDAAAAAAAAAVATAHHGLAALQAATVPQQIQHSPTQYPLPPLATPINAGIQYQMPPGTGGTAPQSKQQGAPKATRLRRACDMCSARKVKVSAVSLQCHCGEETGRERSY